MVTCVRNCCCGCSQVHSDDENGIDFSQEQFAVGYICKQCRSSNSSVAMVLFLPKLWSPDRVCWKWNRCGWWQQDASRLSQKRTRANTKTWEKLAQATQATQTSTPARSVVERDTGWNIAGEQGEEHTTPTTTTTTTQTRTKTTRKAKAKANSWTWCERVRFQKQFQPCRIPQRHQARLTLLGAVETRNRKVGSWEWQ